MTLKAADILRNVSRAKNRAGAASVASAELARAVRGQVADANSPAEKFLRRWRDAEGPDLVREYRFHPERKWRFDFAFPTPCRGDGIDGCLGVAIEVDGAIYAKGRHTRGKGFAADVTKLNAATAMGWRVFRVTTDHLDDGVTLPLILAAVDSVDATVGALLKRMRAGGSS